MPLLSILTPVYAPTAQYLKETIASVERQVLPDGWQVEWIVQEDGKFQQLNNYFSNVSCARYEANKAKFSLCHTRNLALSRADGELVQILDHDDVLLPGALASLIKIFEHENVHWAVGQADDLLPNGERESFESALPFGMLQAGTVNDWAIEHGGNWPIHCAGLMIRTATLRALGGWAGIPVDDDIAMFAALAEITNGFNEREITWLYRQHHSQTHRSATWKSRGSEGRRIALERVAALRQVRLSLENNMELRETGKPASRLPVGDLHPMKDKHPI